MYLFFYFFSFFHFFYFFLLPNVGAGTEDERIWMNIMTTSAAARRPVFWTVTLTDTLAHGATELVDKERAE
jgi:hypothetical protein